MYGQKKLSDLSYHVRVSNRAKRVNLCIKPGIGLEVVVPKRFDQSRITKIIKDNRSWIERNLEKYSKSFVPETISLPSSISLLAIEKTIRIHYKPERHPGRVILQADENNIWIFADQQYTKEISYALCDHLKQVARNVLVPLLSQLAEDAGIEFARVSIRGQRTRWGSCSSKGNINLNYKLLFLPRNLVCYVLLHELAHRRFLNHSARYWEYLATLCPNARALDRQLAKSGRLVPLWLEG